MQEAKIKLLIADDHAILRHGLRRILEAEPDMAVVGEAGTGTDAVKRAKQLKPDVIIMDISMPEQDGIESMRQIVKTLGSRVLILSVHLEHQVITEAVSAGAAGYLGKDSVDQELVAAVRTVVRGGTVFSANISKRLAESSQIPALAGPRSLDLLTSRERQIFLLLAEGKSPSDIAGTLFLSPKTVHT
ncbi:MAG: response regulator transcription factor, partial [Acidobacteria bacterium]|nr:response regulator transcription factor [Acidobacteriota bacterium]